MTRHTASGNGRADALPLAFGANSDYFSEIAAMTYAPSMSGAAGTVTPSGIVTGSIAVMQCWQASSITHLNEGTVFVTVFFMSLRFVKTSALQPGIQDVQTSFLG